MEGISFLIYWPSNDLLGLNDIPSPFVVRVRCLFEIAIFAVLFPSSPISAPHYNVLLLIEIDL